MAYNLWAEYSRSAKCKDRQESGLMKWSAIKEAEPIPAEPTKLWVQQRYTAERIPSMMSAYVGWIIGSMVKVAEIQQNIRTHLNNFNSDSVETTIDGQVDTAINAIMPNWCANNVTAAQVDQWLIDHDLPPLTQSTGMPATQPIFPSPPPM